MLSIFRQKNVLSGVVLFVLCVLLKLPELLNPHVPGFSETAALASALFPFLDQVSNALFWGGIISMLIVFFQALLLNYIVTSHAILYKNTFLPALFFILLNSFYPEQSEFSPQLLANTFVLLLFQRLCYLYESDNPLLVVFDTGFCLGLGILFNYDLAIFLPFILISVVIFKSFNIRYLIISVLGIFLPLYFTAIFFYLTDNQNELLLYVRKSFEKELMKSLRVAYDKYIPWILLLPVVLISGFELQQNFFRNRVKTRRILQCVGLMFVFGLFSLFIENNNFIYAICYLSIPMSIVTAYFFISEKKFLLKELILLALISLAFYYHFS